VQNMNASSNSRGIGRWILQIVIMTIITGVILFVSAGRLNWIGGWAFLGLNIFTQLLSAIILIPRQPDMLADRSQVRTGTKSWDRLLTPAITILGTLAIIVIAGLDARFAWSSAIPAGLWWAALLLAWLCQLFVLWAMASNRFFATTVRIQEERSHQVVDVGPYRFIRHPGYAGSVVYTLLIPLVLGSYLTYIPAMFTVFLLVVRTQLEDRTLQAELPGYTEYTPKVPHRLIPGIW
jgi:protein-S-isoprenylcysteine O-methyltransferase Ste14